jgi:inorganic triphosphatase YgiF
MAAELVERELKFEVGDGFAVPEVQDLVADGRVEWGQQSLDSVYFDTESRDLLACGVTLRCRTGTADSGWQLKIPTGDTRT